MARTARTADKAPGWGGGSSNGEGEGRWAGHHGSAVAAAAASASSAAGPRFTQNSRIRSDASECRRGSSSDARMPPPVRDGGPPSAAMAMGRHRQREDRGRPPSYGNDYAYAHDRFARGREGGDLSGGGRHHSTPRYNENWGRDDRRGGGYGDGPPDMRWREDDPRDTRRYDGPRSGDVRRGRERGWEGNKRDGSRDDERRETRDRDRHCHQPHGRHTRSFNDRPHRASEHNGFQNEHRPHKRRKHGRHHHDKSRNRGGGGGQHQAHRQEQPVNSEDVRALKENFARLERQVGDLVSALHPKNNNAVAQSIAGGSGQNAVSPTGPTANDGTGGDARPADSERPAQSIARVATNSHSTGTDQAIAIANAGMATIASQRQANPKKETSNEDDPCFDVSTDEDANFTNNDQFDDDEDASGTDANGSAEDANIQATEDGKPSQPEASANADGQINDEAQDDVPGEVSNSPRDSTGDESDAVGEQGGKNEEDSNTDHQITGGGTKNQILFSKAIGDDSDSSVQSEANSEEENAQNVSLDNATADQPAYKTTGEDSDNDGNSDDDEDSVDPVLRDYYDPEGELAFCCQNCRCWETAEKRFSKVKYIRNNCGNSSSGSDYGNTKLYHRACCHNDTETSDDYLSLMARARDDAQMAAAKALSSPTKGNSGAPLRGRIVDHGAVKRSYNTAKREEARFENEEYDAANDSVIYSNPAYTDSCEKFGQRCRKGRRSGLFVLDLFSGIGSGTVVLKRLKLPIHTIVHVEHDAVAVSVCKHNHKGDGINHTYVEAFEQIYGAGDNPDEAKVSSLVEKHGPFDLVLAGAPCQNYSGLNSHRDVTSNNAQYLPKVGLLIRKLNDIQSSKTEDVLFLSENVVFKHHEEVDKCYSDKAEGLTPLRMDAKDFGPVKRNRFYWINMPVESTDAIKQVASAVSVDGLLDDGFEATARLLQSEGEKLTPVKANTFLASECRIDDSRMYKCKPSTESNARRKYQIETYSVEEREKMMGLPPGYVEKPLKRLFSQLAQNAFYIPETSEGVTFRTFLPRDLWRFRKTTKFRFHPDPSDPFFHLSLSSPQEGKSQPSFYTEEQYCKHLLGNGWSVPVVEHLLGKLRDLFAEDAMETYDGYDYRHPWEPYLSLDC